MTGDFFIHSPRLVTTRASHLWGGVPIVLRRVDLKSPNYVWR